MKKISYIIFTLFIVTILLTGCSGLGVAEKAEETTETTEATIDFQTQYADIAEEGYCKIASDGSYISLDSNPFDFENDDLAAVYADDVITQVQRINSDLGFTEAVTEKIKTTNSLQGKQTEENEKYRVTWSYHPDNGLQIIYEKK